MTERELKAEVIRLGEVIELGDATVLQANELEGVLRELERIEEVRVKLRSTLESHPRGFWCLPKPLHPTLNGRYTDLPPLPH
jgi:hypothetical protein